MRFFILIEVANHYWRSDFEIETVSTNSKCVKLPPLIKAFLAKMAIEYLKGPIQIITTLLHQKGWVKHHQIQYFP